MSPIGKHNQHVNGSNKQRNKKSIQAKNVIYTGNRGKTCTNRVCLTSVQSVQSDDVIPAHLGGCAKFNVGIGDRNHGGLVVRGEGVPAVNEENRG